MTNEEAIKVLNLHEENWERLLREHIAEQQEGEEMVEALGKAIEALKNERPKGKKGVLSCEGCKYGDNGIFEPCETCVRGKIDQYEREAKK